MAELDAEGMREGQRILCAGCRRTFRFGLDRAAAAIQRPPEAGARPMPQTRWAGAAKWLGVVSFLPLLGLAALTAGVLGVRDIRRHPGRSGMGSAVFGIVAGAVTTLGWLFVGAVALLGIYVMHSSRTTTDPGEMAEIAARIGTFTLPAGLQPLDGEQVAVAGIRAVRYGRWSMPGPPDTTLVVMQYPEPWASDRQTLEHMLRNRAAAWPLISYCAAGEKRQETYTIRGRPVAAALRVGKDPQTGTSWREYIAVYPGDHCRIGVLLLTGGPDGLSDEEVRQCLESFQ
jgi:hypothetical protein